MSACHQELCLNQGLCYDSRVMSPVAPLGSAQSKRFGVHHAIQGGLRPISLSCCIFNVPSTDSITLEILLTSSTAALHQDFQESRQILQHSLYSVHFSSGTPARCRRPDIYWDSDLTSETMKGCAQFVGCACAARRSSNACHSRDHVTNISSAFQNNVGKGSESAFP